MPSDPHVYPVQIEPSDIDFMGHVNNATYLKWVQAAVFDHWRKLAPSDAVSAYAWVAVKHEITYRKPAFLNDSLFAVVQLERVRRESAFYSTAFKRGAELIAEAESRWCCLCAESLQPTRLPDSIVAAFLNRGE
jgi:acyl-CoA thioester hydrolase